MKALIVQTEIPGLFDVTIPETNESWTDLTVNQVTSLIAERHLMPL